MIIKTSELEGAALDWAVMKAAGMEPLAIVDSPEDIMIFARFSTGATSRARASILPLSPSTNWSQGGPLTTRIVSLTQDYDGNWYAIPKTEYGVIELSGPTLLIAAMRAIVAAELGDEVDVPEELL